jgi:hypothetical protein
MSSPDAEPAGYVVALCDDGTVWWLDFWEDQPIEWQPLPEIPQAPKVTNR